MLAPQAVFLLLLAASVIANSIGDGTRALSINVRRGAVSDGSPEDVASKLQWAKDELIRAGLKHPWRLSQEAQDNLVHEVSGMRKRATEAPLKNWGSSYTVSTDIGTPPQTFDSMIDTGSGDFWVIERCMNQTECGQSKPFDETKSSTFKGTQTVYNISYLSGETSGYWAQDVVAIGDQSNTTWFGAADHVTEWFSAQSALIGFCFVTTVKDILPWWLQVLPHWQQPLFSMYLGRVSDDSLAYRGQPTSNKGELLLGGTNTSLYAGDINYVPLQPTTNRTIFWEIPMDGVKVNGRQVPFHALPVDDSDGSRNRRRQNATAPSGAGPNQPQHTAVPGTKSDTSRSAVIDSGTTLIYGPVQDVEAIYAAIPNAFTYGGGFFFPAPAQRSALNLSFTFGGVDYPIYDGDIAFSCGPGYQWPFYRELNLNSRTLFCQGAINAQQGSNSWLVGMAFLKNVYAVYRAEPQAVGFARLSDAADIVYGTPWLPAAGAGRGSITSSSGIPSASVGGSPGSSSHKNGARPRASVSIGAVIGLSFTLALWLN